MLTWLSATAQLTEQQQIQKLNLVYQQLRSNYVDDVPLEPLVQEAIIATLKRLDPHSSYLDSEQMANLRQRLRGEFAGVGIRYIMHRDTLVVRGVIEHSPAERAKIEPNDRITAIDNRSIVGISLDSIPKLLRGKVGSTTTIRVVRRGEPNTLNISLKRDIIESSAITTSFSINSIGYIAISKFSKPLASEFLAAYRRLGDIKSLIIDLRDNSGGAITSAIDLTGLFLSKGDVIVSTEGRTNSIVYDKKKDGPLRDIPLVVIINEGSASASEIFAGAIQDHDRGVIVGRTSFGKGLVQRVIDFKDGSGMTLTVARYKTPSGRIIQRPYTMGQGDEYMHDTIRYMHPGSIPHNDTLLFATLKRGRRVYGGGGITPDIYIDNNAVRLSQSVVKAHSEACFEHTAIDIWDHISADELIANYPTVKQFYDNYQISDTIKGFFIHSSGISSDSLSAPDCSFIRVMILATMAEHLYGGDARYYIYNIGFDPMVRRAQSLASDTEEIERVLRGVESID